ncbi:MAG: arginine--tRNA ligase [Saprospiraceae bacterium]|nr:arginine--tRNA ligase [Saprospiraceae bacterium]
MNIKEKISHSVVSAIESIYGVTMPQSEVVIQETKKEFTGEFTVLTFPFVKSVKSAPELIADQIGTHLLQQDENIVGYNVLKGFLNLELSQNALHEILRSINSDSDYWRFPSNGQSVMVEFASPNTNKPLHLGHIRNILLGWSTNKILSANGYNVIKTQVVNNRGIAICKSMLAWQLWGEGSTPASTGIKGDHFVGDYYVLFEQKFKEEYAVWQESPEANSILTNKKPTEVSDVAFFKQYKNECFNNYSKLGASAREMLIHWEDSDPVTIALWEKMNGWVYEGFDITYAKLGVDFDKIYYESDTYLLGKSIVDKGLASQTFYRKDDGSVWIDLENQGLDQKLVLRSDGTSVYITQDLGTAEVRFEEFGVKRMVYVVADEQNYHFQVLFAISKALKAPYADGLFHLSYGMVELPSGRMKSREGTVVDADDLIDEVIREARNMAEERGEIGALEPAAREDILRKIGMGALKYFMIKVNPQKKMIFDPKESVDMQGNTGPYIQNAYVRIQSILRKSTDVNNSTVDFTSHVIEEAEKQILLLILQYKEVLAQAAKEMDPSAIAAYCYQLAKAFHKFYHDCPILSAESESAILFRIQLSKIVSSALYEGMDLLGIEMPDRM